MNLVELEERVKRLEELLAGPVLGGPSLVMVDENGEPLAEIPERE